MPSLRTKLLQDFYKITPMRTGILTWYPFEKTASVFEQSCGALTEWLQSRCQKVISVSDGNLRNEKFDYLFIVDPSEVTVELLREYHDLLNPHGRLLLVFENPFGLQYFAGKRNMRTNLPFTFQRMESKKEVEYRLKQAGFKGQKWYYPFPNHYFTCEVYSENYLPNEFLNHRRFDFLEDDYTKIFNEQLLWKEVIRNGAYEFLCNSYFVEARICTNDLACDVDYAAITSYREPDRAFVTTVHASGVAKKTAIHKQGVLRLKEIERTHYYLSSIGVNSVPAKLEENSLIMPRLNLPTLWDYWAHKLGEGTLAKEELFSQFDRIRDAIYKSSESGRLYWELVPANCFYDEYNDNIIFFDQEFYWENVDPDAGVARAIGALIWSDGFRIFEQPEQWFEELKTRYNLLDKWDEITAIAWDEVNKFVFNPEKIFPIGRSVLEAMKRVANFQASAEAEEKRFNRLFIAADKLRDYCVKRLIIYGYGVRGKTLRSVLELGDFEVVCIIDKNIISTGGAAFYSDINKVSAGIKYDAIVVTPLKQSIKIADELRRATKSRIFILEDLIC